MSRLTVSDFKIFGNRLWELMDIMFYADFFICSSAKQNKQPHS